MSWRGRCSELEAGQDRMGNGQELMYHNSIHNATGIIEHGRCQGRRVATTVLGGRWYVRDSGIRIIRCFCQALPTFPGSTGERQSTRCPLRSVRENASTRPHDDMNECLSAPEYIGIRDYCACGETDSPSWEKVREIASCAGWSSTSATPRI